MSAIIMKSIPASCYLSVAIVLILMSMLGCVSGPPTEMVLRDDHAGLADWYQSEAARLRSEADKMRRMKQQYDSPLFQPSPKETKEQFITHCETFIKYFIQAANEADALAKLHRQEETMFP